MKLPKFTVKVPQSIKQNPKRIALGAIGLAGALVVGLGVDYLIDRVTNKGVASRGLAGTVTTNFTSQASDNYSTPNTLVHNLGQGKVNNSQTKFEQVEKVIAGKSYTFETNSFHRPGELTHIVVKSEDKILERDDATKTMNITSDFVYVPTRITNSLGNIRTSFSYIPDKGLSPKKALVHKPNLEGISNGVLNSDQKAVEYNLEMMNINGTSFYNPFNQPSEVTNANKLPFVAIPKDQTKERIHQGTGVITLESSMGGFEYIRMARKDYNARTNQVNVPAPLNGQIAPSFQLFNYNFNN